MAKDTIKAIIASFVLGACVGLVGMHLGMKPRPCGQAAVSLRPTDILEYKTIVCSFSDKEQNYFCSPWEPSAFRPAEPARDPGCDANPPTKFCAEKATSFYDPAPLKIK